MVQDSVLKFTRIIEYYYMSPINQLISQMRPIFGESEQEKITLVSEITAIVFFPGYQTRRGRTRGPK